VFFCLRWFHWTQKTQAVLISEHNLLSNWAQLWEKRPGHANLVGARSLVTHSYAEGVQKSPSPGRGRRRDEREGE